MLHFNLLSCILRTLIGRNPIAPSIDQLVQALNLQRKSLLVIGAILNKTLNRCLSDSHDVYPLCYWLLLLAHRVKAINHLAVVIELAERLTIQEDCPSIANAVNREVHNVGIDIRLHHLSFSYWEPFPTL
jgi:hypothetical protein